MICLMFNQTKMIMKTDENLQADVMEELRWEPTLHASQIGVAVKEGIVTLTGEVKSYVARTATERAAKRVQGVKAVVQEVGVKPGGGKQHSDEQIAHAIVQWLEWHSEIPQDLIDVTVQDGRVTLEGEVAWHFQRKAAVRSAESVLGVKGVNNHIRVKPGVEKVDVKNKIRNALKRSALVEAQQIKVETKGNQVVLKGKVHSWTERKEAEEAAWSAPGVTSVENDLVVSLFY